MSGPAPALTLLAPMDGWAAPLEETPDPVFAGRMLGDGVALDPTSGELRAPCDGVVIALAACGHAVTLRSSEGAEVLIHIGIDTVKCAGEGFEPKVEVGRRVTAGELLIAFDLERLARRASSLVSPMVVVGGPFAVEAVVTGREVRRGEPLMTLRATAEAPVPVAGGEGAVLGRRVRVGAAHGLHARPAALLAREAGRFAADIRLAAAGKQANVRSPVSLMALGARRGDEVELSARGDDAAAALDALAAVIGAEDAATSAPAYAPAAPLPPAGPPGVLAGAPAAPGLAIGAAARLFSLEPVLPEISGPPDAELEMLRSALEAARSGLAQRLTAERGERREILQAHLGFLEDPELARAAEAAVAAGLGAGAAWAQALVGFEEQLRATGDQRMIERAADLADLKRQVLIRLAGETVARPVLPDHAVILADDLLPSELIELDRDKLAGLAIARGGPTSHVALLAAAMGIPAVVALGPRVLAVEAGALVILDGEAGSLRVGPGPEEVAAAQTRLYQRRAARAKARAEAQAPCLTADGVRIEVFANLAAVDEVRVAVENGAEGCGLLRTEFLFQDRPHAPDEAEQLAAYQAIAEALEGRPLVIRTLDAGADKPVAYLPTRAEANPALGLRGVRASLAFPELLATQLRAILRVRPAGQARIMIPMVASLAELSEVRAVLSPLAAEAGLAAPALGVMVETPAAAVTADLIAAEADFLSIGTNDLAQYALAMDRTSSELARLVDALHPAVLRLIERAAAGAEAAGRPIAVCGGAASDPAAAPILIGLGVTRLSVAPASIPDIKAAIRAFTLGECRDLARRALGQTSPEAVRALKARPARPVARSGAQP